MPWLLLALGVGAYLYFQKGQEFLAEYEVKLKDAIFNYNKTKDALFTKFFFTIRIEVDNVTDFTGTLEKAKLKLTYEGKNLGTVEKREPVTIVKNGKTKVDIPVAVPTLSFLGSIPKIISVITNKQPLVFKINGDLKFAIGTVTVNQEYKVATNV